MIRHVPRRRRVLDQELEERPQIRPGFVDTERRRARLGIRVDDREIDLSGIRAEIHEELVDRVEHLRRARVRAVDLVDRHDHRQVVRHRLLEDVARLRQRPLGRIHQQQDGIDHVQAALDLSAEVGMAGRVDDVQANPVVVDRSLLGENGDPLLALQVVGVHDPLHHDLVGAEGTGLAKHGVDEGGLAVVDVGDDGQISDIGASGRAGARGRGGTG